MIQVRNLLWGLLFSGIVLHMTCISNFYMTITAMVKQPAKNNGFDNDTFLALCSRRISSIVAANVTKHIHSASVSSQSGEYDWSARQKTIVISSSSWLMNISILLSGIISQKYGGKIVLGYSKLALATLSFLIPLAADFGFVYVVVIRVMLGIAAGSSIGPAHSALISKWAPPVERGKFSSTLSGIFLGVAFSNFVNGFILHWFGWRAVFYSSGGMVFLWCVAWFYLVYDEPIQHPHISKKELDYIERSIGLTVSKTQLPIPWVSILTSVPFLVNTICQFSTALTFSMFLLFMPTYLREVHGFSAKKIGLYASVPYILQTVFAIGFGSFTDYLLRVELLSRTNVRKFAAFFGTILTGTLLGCLSFGDCNLFYVFTLISVILMLLGATPTSYNANIIDISPNFTAILYGIQGFFSGSGGTVVSFMVDYLARNGKGIEQWNKMFLIIGIWNIASGLLFFIFADSKVQPWNFLKVTKKINGSTIKNVADQTIFDDNHEEEFKAMLQKLEA